ncbi:CD276 antigen-like [Poeciliopsis prolifica]|uniref:CD276 antigen-like n=1 Tax=Poeciliopsis prolifica TaxID=188132 RepID=UPI0024144C59|nr:CD276 antigen-like [Poeciliopsis prolifica]
MAPIHTLVTGRRPRPPRHAHLDTPTPTRPPRHAHHPNEVKVVGHEPISAKVGGDVILPCHLEPPFDVNNLTIEWRFKDKIIHLHRSRATDDETPNPKYINRTSMFHDEFEKGNISLKLTKVTQEDEGNYICFVPKLQSQVRKGNVTLILDENGSQGNLTATRGTDPGVIVGIIGAFIGGAVVLGALIIIIIYCVLRCRRREPNRRENVDPGNEAEVEIPLQDLGQN